MKWLWIGLGVVVLAVGAAGYVLNSGAPAAPKGVCPALLSAAPVDADIAGYFDLTPLRTPEMAAQFGVFEQSPQAAPYRDFVEKTNFHVDRDLDRMLLAASTDSGSAAVVLEGRFDQPRISSYVATQGSMHHYDAGDLYHFQGASPSAGASMMFLEANRLVFATGRDPDSQILMMVDAAKSSDAALHEDLCERAQRVAGATFFVVGDVPKSAVAQLTPVVSRQNPAAAEILQTLRGWDMAYWMDGGNLRMEVEGEFDGVYDAIQARVAFEKVRATIAERAATMKAAPLPAAGPAGPVLDALAKNLAVTVDGRYVRVGTLLTKSDLEKIGAASRAAQH